jgi:type VI protein secretion system component VasF
MTTFALPSPGCEDARCPGDSSFGTTMWVILALGAVAVIGFWLWWKWKMRG